MRKKKRQTAAPERAEMGGMPAETSTQPSPLVASGAPIRLKLLVTVVNRPKAEFYADYLQSNFNINFQTILAGEGTADSETLRLLGLSDNAKSVIFSVVREDVAHAALAGLEERFASIKNGKGIACTVPLTGTIGVAIYRFLGNITA